MTMKSLGDAMALRNRLIEHLEEADTECGAKDRESLLTFVVVGGGFAGVETVGSINDFLKDALPYYPDLKPQMLRVVLVHPGDYILPELGEKLGRYASRKLAERGVELRVALDWTLDVFFSKDLVQFLHERSPVISDASAAPLAVESSEPVAHERP